MRSDRTHLDRRRFLALGGMAAIAAACSSSSGDDDTNESDANTSASTTPPPANTAAVLVTTDVTSTSVAADDATTVAPTETAPAFGAADFAGLGVCTLLAETAAGPFPNLARLERRDVTEGYQGHPLRLGLRIVDEACVPVAGAVVEIWHADASGDYSSYADGGGGKDEGEGTTFIRGAQTAGDDGIVEFHTIYPGWYPGRAVHIHLSVHVDGDTALTSQLFFDDAYTEQVHTIAPYAEFGPPDTSNGSDGLAGPAIATGGMLALAPGATSDGTGTVALANLGISA